MSPSSPIRLATSGGVSSWTSAFDSGLLLLALLAVDDLAEQLDLCRHADFAGQTDAERATGAVGGFHAAR